MTLPVLLYYGSLPIYSLYNTTRGFSTTVSLLVQVAYEHIRDSRAGARGISVPV